MAAVWQFVDRPESSADVLLDMSHGDWYLSAEGFDISPPPRLRSIAKNNMSDGALVTASTRDLRELRFTLELRGATEDDRNAQLKALEAEFDKPTNLLMYKPERGTFPVFFRTFAADFKLDNQYVPGKTWRVNCVVPAEPFAIGERHDVVAGLVVQNNPASGTNPTYFDITGIKGDVPAPAFVRVGSGLSAGSVFTLAQRTQNNPEALTVSAQCESGTLGTNTTVSANDTTMSGSGSNYVTCTFGTNTLTTRVSVSVPTTTSGEALKGRFRVFVKVRRSANTSAFTLRYQVSGGSSVVGQQVSYDTGLGNLWAVDLGILELPLPGPTPVSVGYSGLPAGYSAPTLEIQAKRDSGALSLDFDYVYLMPADERMCHFRPVSTVQYVALDGPNDMTYGMPAGSSPFDSALANRTVDNAGGLISRQAGLPMLVPGVVNRWYVLRATHNVNATSTYDVSYWPRWLEVATS